FDVRFDDIVVRKFIQTEAEMTRTLGAEIERPPSVSRASDGRAIGAATVEALQGATVRATDITGVDGIYALTGLPAGTYDIRASADGYVTSTLTGVTVPASGSATVSLSLTPAPPPGSIAYIYDR